MIDFSTPSQFKPDDASFYKKIRLSDYIILFISRNISDYHLNLIEEGFMDKWNSSTGEFLGDGEMKKDDISVVLASLAPLIVEISKLLNRDLSNNYHREKHMEISLV